jgi:uncharacterized protein (DUF697 family)
MMVVPCCLFADSTREQVLTPSPMHVMLRELSHVYDVPFSAHRAKSLVAALAGGLGYGLSGDLLTRLVKLVPIAGPVLAGMAFPTAAAAITSTIGKIFMQHYETGGTLLDFDPERTRAYYAKQLGSTS